MINLSRAEKFLLAAAAVAGDIHVIQGISRAHPELCFLVFAGCVLVSNDEVGEILSWVSQRKEDLVGAELLIIKDGLIKIHWVVTEYNPVENEDDQSMAVD